MSQNILKKHPCLAKTGLVLGAVLLALSAGECLFRLMGMTPGFIPRYDTGLAKVENLEPVKPRWITGKDGVFAANPDYDWPKNHINSDGFRSIEFMHYDSIQPKVLFLGDSFTWGVSAWPESNCFADIIGTNNYVVFNTGIPGTGPNQYAYLAEKYVPLLEPDYVAVMFFMGNDFIRPSPMLPYKNLHHITNAGWMYAFNDNGVYMPLPREAYKYWQRHSNWLCAPDRPDLPDNIIRRLFLKTVTGSYCWYHLSPVMVRVGSIFGYRFKPGVYFCNKPGEHTKKSLLRIKDICEKYGAKFMLFIIPVDPEMKNKNNSIKDNLHVLAKFDPLVPNFITTDLYKKTSCHHLTNKGHRLYADFILKELAKAVKN